MAQSDTSYFYLNKAGFFTVNKDSAQIHRMVIKPKTADEKLFMVHDKYANGNSKFITHSSNSDGSVLQGYSIEFYKNGKKKSEENFVDDALNGPITVYYPNGKLYMTGIFAPNGALHISQYRDSTGNILATDGTGEAVEYNEEFTEITARGMIKKSIKQGKWMHFNSNKLWYTIVYREGQMMGGTGYDSVGREYPFLYLQEAVQFKHNYGLDDFISGKIKYSKEAKNAGIRGTVHVSFVIEKDGRVEDIKVTEGIGGGLDEEAVRVISLTMKMWQPAKRFGLPVRTVLNVPVNFGLKTGRSSFKPTSQ